MSASDPVSPHVFESTIPAGMPQLGLCGLSENWLLKECGHRHWTSICEQAGVPSHQIVDSQGHRLYAAFVSIEIDGSPLGFVQENDDLHLRTSLLRFSSKRFFSETTVRSPSGDDTSVRMVSIFVRKPIFDDNRSLSGGHPDPLKRIPQGTAPDHATRMLEAWKRARTDGEPQIDTGYAHQICPTTEFNGARMLYFASFQHILDQAEWRALDVEQMQFASTRRRQLFFYGNVNFDDVLDVSFSRVDWSGADRSHRVHIRRRGDGALLAVAETHKTLVAPGPGASW